MKNSGYPGDWGGGIFINFGSTPSLDSLIIIDNTGGGYDGSYRRSLCYKRGKQS